MSVGRLSRQRLAINNNVIQSTGQRFRPFSQARCSLVQPIIAPSISPRLWFKISSVLPASLPPCYLRVTSLAHTSHVIEKVLAYTLFLQSYTPFLLSYSQFLQVLHEVPTVLHEVSSVLHAPHQFTQCRHNLHRLSRSWHLMSQLSKV